MGATRARSAEARRTAAILELVENTMHRYQCIIGRTMRSRTLQGQRVESRVGCRILNTMTALGMPETRQVG